MSYDPNIFDPITNENGVIVDGFDKINDEPKRGKNKNLGWEIAFMIFPDGWWRSSWSYQSANSGTSAPISLNSEEHWDRDSAIRFSAQMIYDHAACKISSIFETRVMADMIGLGAR